MSLVVDSSVILAWLLRDEQSSEADEIIRRALQKGASAPRLIDLEIANGLRGRVRRKMIDAAYRDAALADYRQLRLSLDSAAELSAIVELSDRYDLTSYDAAYLELACRLGFELATFDSDLADAGRSAGLVVSGV